GTAKHLGRREEEDDNLPSSFAWLGNRLGRETKGLVCVPLWWPFLSEQSTGVPIYF
ncbi:hypothetical protein HMPREF0083_00959, partial [Aneurinibacillus aneurinilyticus ATCC 12856]